MEEEFLTVEKAIEPILLNNPYTRADDMLLYLEYLRRKERAHEAQGEKYEE